MLLDVSSYSAMCGGELQAKRMHNTLDHAGVAWHVFEDANRFAVHAVFRKHGMLASVHKILGNPPKVLANECFHLPVLGGLFFRSGFLVWSDCW